MIRTIIVDDEPLARKGVQRMLEAYSDFEIVAQCTDGMEAVRQIEALQPDVVFLDIQMPELDGFEVLTQLKSDLRPLVVFVTAYDEYALKAFRAHAVDYLLKPIEKKDFAKAVERVRMLLQARNSAAHFEKVQSLLEDIQKKPRTLQRFIVREKNKLLVVPLENVRFFEADGDYVRLHTQNDTHLIRETMARLEQQLDPADFARINRSAIVRLSLIRALEPIAKGDYELQLNDGSRHTLSRTYRENVLNALQ